MVSSASTNGQPRRTKDAIASAEDKPRAVEVNVEGIPPSVRDLRQWCCWSWQWKSNTKGVYRWTKPPIDPATGCGAKSNDPTTWATFAAALAYHRAGNSDGIGFMLQHPHAGVDMDDCRDPDTGEVDPWARKVVEQLDTYTEVSPSGTGLKMLVVATLPPGGRRRRGHVEMYCETRYFTITGRRLDGTPAEPQERQTEVDRAYAEYVATDRGLKQEKPSKQAAPANGVHKGELFRQTATGDVSTDEGLLAVAMNSPKSGAKFSRLWNGDASGYDSQSEAELALCNFLAFYCGKPDAERVDALFRQSKLMRDKWERKDYRDKTIGLALDGRTDFYRQNGRHKPQPQTEKAAEPPEPPNDGGEGFGDDDDAPEAPRPPSPQKVIREHWQQLYQFTHKEGAALWSSAQGREVKQQELLTGASSRLLVQLMNADGAVAFCKGLLSRDRMPGFFRLWAPTAIADLRLLLDTESNSELYSELKAGEFCRQVRSVLVTHITIRAGRRDESGDDTERVPMIDLLERFAKPKRWNDVRGYRVWSMRNEGESLRVVMMPDLFTQTKSPLAKLPDGQIAALGKRYGVFIDQPPAKDPKVAGGLARALELRPEFLARVLRPADEMAVGK